jgi:hypothetical protein
MMIYVYCVYESAVQVTHGQGSIQCSNLKNIVKKHSYIYWWLNDWYMYLGNYTYNKYIVSCGVRDKIK